MTNIIDMPGNALGEWKEPFGHSAGMRYHTRVLCGWEDEPGAIALTVGIDVNGERYISLSPQRQLKRGHNKGLWTTGAGDIHSREDFLAVLSTLIEAGQKAGWC